MVPPTSSFSSPPRKRGPRGDGAVFGRPLFMPGQTLGSRFRGNDYNKRRYHLSELHHYVPRNTTRASTAFTP
jgi:hypothetical protein